MLDSEQLSKLRKAGRISAEARDLGLSLVKKGVKYFDVAEEVEGYIRKNGCKLACPCNISVNEIAAHYTPSVNDKLTFEVGDVVKVDCGAALDGYVGDTAGTVEVGTNRFRDLIDAAHNARDSVMEFIGEGVPINEIGKVVTMTIEGMGYKPIRNLSGHQIEPYNLHAGLSIPNYDAGNTDQLKAGMVIACEPFATNGEGLIDTGRPGNICRISRDRPPKEEDLRQFYDYIMEEFRTFPFCARSCDFPKAEFLLKKLVRQGIASSYAILNEIRGGCVTQWEHTVYIAGPKGEVTTTY
jgi:methionyl aminopeptidase